MELEALNSLASTRLTVKPNLSSNIKELIKFNTRVNVWARLSREHGKSVVFQDRSTFTKNVTGKVFTIKQAIQALCKFRVSNLRRERFLVVEAMPSVNSNFLAILSLMATLNSLNSTLESTRSITRDIETIIRSQENGQFLSIISVILLSLL